MDNKRHAALYAAMKMIEAELEDQSMDPGSIVELTGKSVTIVFPKGTKVSRSLGTNGDGTSPQKNTQSLYGYGVWCYLLQRLQKFNQGNAIWNVVKDVWDQAAQGNIPTVESGLVTLDPELASFLEQLKNQPGPMKNQATTRRLTKGKDEPQLEIKEAA